MKKVIALGCLVNSDGAEVSSKIAVDDQEDEAPKRCKSKRTHLVSSTAQDVPDVLLRDHYLASKPQEKFTEFTTKL